MKDFLSKPIVLVTITISAIAIIFFTYLKSDDCQPEGVVLESGIMYQNKITKLFRLVTIIEFTVKGELDLSSFYIVPESNKATISTMDGSATTKEYELFAGQSLPAYDGTFYLTIKNHCTGEERTFEIKGAEPE
jgi:hypothetical protein